MFIKAPGTQASAFAAKAATTILLLLQTDNISSSKLTIAIDDLHSSSPTTDPRVEKKASWFFSSPVDGHNFQTGNNGRD